MGFDIHKYNLLLALKKDKEALLRERQVNRDKGSREVEAKLKDENEVFMLQIQDLQESLKKQKKYLHCVISIFN